MSLLCRQSSLSRTTSLSDKHQLKHDTLCAPFACRNVFGPRLPTRARLVKSQQAQATDEVRPSAYERHNDPFKAAATRLECLLNGSGEGDEEYVEQLVEEEGSEFKVTVSMLMGSLILLGSFGLSTVFGSDPWGGMSFSYHSLGAGLIGLLAAKPLAAVKLWSWTPDGEKSFPVLQHLHSHQVKQSKPWLSDLTLAQVLTVMLAETIPPLFLLFPASQAAVTCLLTVSDAMVNPFPSGCPVPAELVAGGTLAITAALSGLVASSEYAVTDAEYQVVDSAVANADRYYRVMAADLASSGTDVASASSAFKSVAVSWVESRMEAAKAATTSVLLTTVYLGILYNITHDMTAPLVAACLAGGVDYVNMYRCVTGSRVV